MDVGRPAHGADRRAFLKAAAALAAAPLLPPRAAAEPPHDTTLAQDFDELWETLRAHYCYFDAKRTDWDRVRATYRGAALAADSVAAFAAVCGRVLDELYDAHTHLADPPDGAHRWPLYDLLAARAGADVRIAAVQSGSAAADAGVRIGDVVRAVDGVPIERRVREVAPRCLASDDPAADAWALNVAVAGRRGLPRTLTVSRPGAAPIDVALPLKPHPDVPSVESRALDGGLGYIAIHTFADDAVPAAFDTALAALRDTRGLVIDVRGNGGGDTALARPVMGRFITQRGPYAMMRRREGAALGAPWTEFVDPLGPFTYINPVIVLVDHWSGSMAEGFPMGLRALGRATLVGTPMMGLGAAVFTLRLDRTGVQAQYSAEPVYDVQGNPRSALLPDVRVADGTDILAAGIAALEAQIPR